MCLKKNNQFLDKQKNNAATNTDQDYYVYNWQSTVGKDWKLYKTRFPGGTWWPLCPVSTQLKWNFNLCFKTSSKQFKHTPSIQLIVIWSLLMLAGCSSIHILTSNMLFKNAGTCFLMPVMIPTTLVLSTQSNIVLISSSCPQVTHHRQVDIGGIQFQIDLSVDCSLTVLMEVLSHLGTHCSGG